MNIITQAVEKLLSDIAGNLVSGTLSDFGSRLEQTVQDCFTMLQTVIPSILRDLDEAILEDAKRKADWVIVRKDQRELVTTFGVLRFTRRYYRHKHTGEMAHLLDRHLGIQSNSKVGGDVRQQAVRQAEHSSYSKSAAVSTPVGLSRMSVCNYISDLKDFPPLEAEGEKRRVRQLYVEADEDHVALQAGRKTQVKLVYIHEGMDEQGGRRKLRNPHYLTWPQEGDTDTLWESVGTFIDKQYDSDCLNRVFLSGDGASWIRAGEEWLYPCVPILDDFHMMKALRGLCGNNRRDISLFLQHVGKDDHEKAAALCARILEGTPKEAKQGKQRTVRYLLNNWQRIRNRNHPGAVGCSAEGHVSHILSERLSSRPCGWSKKNMGNIAQLRVMKANGQVIRYEELAGLKADNAKKKKRGSAEALVHSPGMRKTLTKRAGSYVSDASKNIPVLNHGLKTQLYQALHGLSFDHVAC